MLDLRVSYVWILGIVKGMMLRQIKVLIPVQMMTTTASVLVSRGGLLLLAFCIYAWFATSSCYAELPSDSYPNVRFSQLQHKNGVDLGSIEVLFQDRHAASYLHRTLPQSSAVELSDLSFP